ncbi:hypothetical protein OB955_04805 [Halobacteria archaeon AArc-m2/3/4]|uniref:Envelope protein N-terminal domain-containing protein n=1 Tax=Natronoglomus mannanivorans TaxID=2979990 RepID=A0ABT2QAU4_9EURY|nr:hypothetical protein [Halobacteria archaeon AArc-m2/3/4]
MSFITNKLPSGKAVLVSLMAFMLLAQPVAAIAPVVVGAAVVGGAAGGAGGFYAGSALAEDTEGMGAEEVEQELYRDALSYQDSVDESTTWVENQITDAEQVAIGHAQYAISQALQDEESESVLVNDGQQAAEDHYSTILKNHINSWNSEVESIHSAAQVDLDTEGTSNEIFFVQQPSEAEDDDRWHWRDDTEVEYTDHELPNGETVEMATSLTNMGAPGSNTTNTLDVVNGGNVYDRSSEPSVFKASDPDGEDDPLTLLNAGEHHVDIIDTLEADAETVNNEVEVYAVDIHAAYSGQDVDHIDVVDPSVLSTIGDDTDGVTFASTAAAASGYQTSATAVATFTIVEADGSEVSTSGLLTTRADPGTETDDGQKAWLEGETYAADNFSEDIIIQAIDGDGNVEQWVLEDGDEMTIDDIDGSDHIDYNERNYSEYDSSAYIDELEAQNERLAELLKERQSGGGAAWVGDIWDDIADAFGVPGAIAVVFIGFAGGILAVGVFFRAATP